MISVVIPTLDAAATLPATLDSLVPAAVEGLVREVIVSDGGSKDATLELAAAAGARIESCERGRGGQLARGAAGARGEWLLFLHADTVLEEPWMREAAEFMKDDDRAGVFTLAFNAKGLPAWLVAAGAMVRTRLFAAPYGDQGLLLSRRLYDLVGGHAPMPLFEDVDFVDRLVRFKGRRALRVLKSKARTSAVRYERGGYARRVAKNAWCLALYRLGVSPARIAEIYGR